MKEMAVSDRSPRFSRLLLGGCHLSTWRWQQADLGSTNATFTSVLVHGVFAFRLSGQPEGLTEAVALLNFMVMLFSGLGVQEKQVVTAPAPRDDNLPGKNFAPRWWRNLQWLDVGG